MANHSNRVLPGNGSNRVLPGKTTEFHKADYLNLIRFVNSKDEELNLTLRHPTAGVALDETLGSGILPGSTNWKAVSHLVSKATAFGGSVSAAVYETLDTSLQGFVQELKDGVDIFEKYDDLTKVAASKFPQGGGSSTANLPNTGT